MSTVVAESEVKEILSQLGIDETNSGASTGSNWLNTNGEKIDSYSPVDGSIIASVNSATVADYEACVEKAQAAFKEWRLVPAPKRGEVVRQLGMK